MKEQIEFINNNFKYSLASVLYHSKQYIWDNEEIYSINIFNKYTEFIYCFLNLNYANNEKCLFDINNIEKILEFIYNKINFEFTFANNTNKNNINNNSYSNNFYDEFKNNNIILDRFTGSYQYNNNSLNFQQNLNNNQNNNSKSFSFIKFNLNEVNQFYDPNNINEMNLNQFYNNINLDNCFKYTFKDNKHSIYSFPKILTVVFQTDKCNFILNNELNLAPYTNNFSNDNNGSYFLTSIFCQMSYNKKFINYIFNSQTGSWFSLNDQEMRKVDSVDVNTIPLMMIYQLKSIFQQEYKEIKIKNKLCTTINFQGGLFQTKKLFFDEKDKIIDVRNKIKSWFDIKDPFTFLINGNIAKNYEPLSKALERGSNFLVITKPN